MRPWCTYAPLQLHVLCTSSGRGVTNIIKIIYFILFKENIKINFNFFKQNFILKNIKF